MHSRVKYYYALIVYFIMQACIYLQLFAQLMYILRMNYEDLNKLFEENPEKSQSGLGRFLDRDASVINRMTKGKVQIKSSDVPIILNYFNKGVHVDNKGASIYTIDEIKPSLNKGSNEVISEWQIPASYFENGTKPEVIKNVRVLGDAMSPEINSGDRVFIDTSDTTPSPSGIFILCDNSGYLIRRCEAVINSNPVEIKISAINPAYESAKIALGDTKIIGRVMSHLRKL